MTLWGLTQLTIGLALGLAGLWLISTAVELVRYYRAAEKALTTFYRPALREAQHRQERVTHIVRDMQNIASHSAFIDDDPYVYTRLLVAALSLPEVDE